VRLRLVLVCASLLALTACGSSWHTFRAEGVSVRYPPGWFATSRPLTYVTSPFQALAVASYPLPHDNTGSDGCEPKEALDAMPSDGVFIFGWEYYGAPPDARLFPPRPTHFKLTGFDRYECLGPSYMLRFHASGKFFQVHVAFGRDAGFIARLTALEVLDSFTAE
jgi:hypothetical protein